MQKPTQDWEAAQRDAERRRATGTAIARVEPPAEELTRVRRGERAATLRTAARSVQPLAQPLYRPMRPVTPAPVAPEPSPAKPAEKRLREAAKGVIDAWESGDLAGAVRVLDVVLNGGSGAIGRPVLRNLYHPASYRTSYEVTLTGDELRRLQLLTNAASFNGPVGTTAFIIPPKEMAWAKDRLRKIREAK